MRNTNFSLLFFMSLLVLIFVTFSSVDARNTNMKKKLHKHHKKSHPLPHYDPHPIQPNTFDIMSFNAKGNGVSDDSEVIKRIQNLKIRMIFNYYNVLMFVIKKRFESF